MPKIRIEISPDGTSSRIEAEGFQGASCQNPIQELSKRLGEVVQDDREPEFYETETVCGLCEDF